MRGVSIAAAVRQAGVDLYFNSVRFVAANLVLALCALAVLFAATIWVPSIALMVVLAAPLAGMHRMAADLVRGEGTSFGDFVAGTRTYAAQAVAIATGMTLLAGVLATNLVTGFASDGPIGWFLGATALWGIVALAMFAVAIWPILVDPNHADAPLRRRLQLAGIVVIGRPVRLLALTLLIAGFLTVSVLLLGAIVLVGVAFVSLVATRWVLPAADELEARFEAARAGR